MLAMVIPGFLLLMLVPICCDCQFDVFYREATAATAVLVFIAAYIIGLIYHKAIECLYNSLELRNSKKFIEKNGKQLLDEFKKDGGDAEKYKDLLFNRREYYKAYYALMKNSMLHSIPVMEAQVAFIRNITPVMALYIIAVCCCNDGVLGIKSGGLEILPLVALVVLLVILNKIQNKIYYLIWEGKIYLDEIEKSQINL